MSNRTKIFTTVALLPFALFLSGVSTMSAAAAEAPQPPAHTEWIDVKVLAGVQDFSLNSEAKLFVGPTELRIVSAQEEATIVRRRILSVSTGDERIETGGTTGRVARLLIPYGGGLALGAVTHKKIELLTMEYLDLAGQYHGAVFLVGSEDLSDVVEQLQVTSSQIPISEPIAHPACSEWAAQLNTVRLETINEGMSAGMPPEDRAMLYENLISKLRSEKTIAGVYRAGDRSNAAGCAEFTITIRAQIFNKGDQAVRASVGPLGHFIGTTKLHYHLTVAQRNGTLILDRDMKASEGSDTDSLNITKEISKTVLKSLKRSRDHVRANEAA